MYMEVTGMVYDMLKFCDMFICCHNLSFARAEGGPILADRFPANGPPCLANDIT